MKPYLAKLENVSLGINSKSILRDINLELKKGEITTLIGPNGGGKTSICRILLGLLKPNQGKVFIDAKVKIGYMPQKITIDKTIPLTVKDFLRLSFLEQDQEYRKKIINKFEIEKILDHQIHDLSGGQMQKILFIRSIINKPELLVLDEPTQYMDISATEKFYFTLEEIRKENNCAILLISHDLHFVMQKTDSVFCINHHICCHGSPEAINSHPEYLSLFGKKTPLAVYHHNHDHNH